jgi:hypothetical protein
MLLGASVILFAAIGEPSAVDAGCALAGLMLWLLGVARLLLFATRLPLPGGAPTTAAANSAAVEEEEPTKYCSILGRQDPEPVISPAP